MSRRRGLAIALLLCVGVAVACGSKSPTAPTPAADFASQFDSLWNTFDREYSYFEHKHIDWNAMRTTYRPRALAAADQASFIAVIREMLGQLHDIHVVITNPSGVAMPTYQSNRFQNFDRAVWLQYISRASWTQWSNDSGVGVLDGIPYFAFGGWNTSSLSTLQFDTALERFRTAPVIILDVRMNGGGNDSIAIDFGGRFTASTISYAYTKTRNGPAHTDFTSPQTRTMSPRGPWQYAGRVIVLI